MYVSAYLKRLPNTQVKVLNYNLWDYDLREELKGQDIALFTGFEEFAPSILRDEQVANEMGIPTRLGGALATFGGLTDFQGSQKVGEIEGEDFDIDAVPWPDYGGFGIEEYHRRHNDRYMGVLTSRGCPWGCSFCAQTCKFRMRNFDNVFAEIDHYVEKYRVQTIIFNDNTLNINRARWMQICAGMKERGLTWAAAIRCQPMDDEMVKAARTAGCFYLVVGVESFNQNKLDQMNKRIKTKSIIRTLDLLYKHKIDYHGNILVGFEWESEADIVEEVRSIPSGYRVFPVMVQPFVGTRNGKNRNVTQTQHDRLDGLFRQYAISNGMTCYAAVGGGP